MSLATTQGMRSRRRRPVRRRGGFQPPHCPNPTCDFHRPDPDWPFVRDGFYRRPSDGRRFQAFECRHCGRNFSAVTFSTTYWLRHRRLVGLVATHVTEGAALRQIARALNTSHTTVRRLVSRVGRHCLLYHSALVRDHPLEEALVVDGFETFEYSQYFPFHANLAVGSDSWFLYHFTDSPLRRKGSMTQAQRLRRSELERYLGRPDPKAVELGMAGLLRPLLKWVKAKDLVIYSDDHPAYRRALRRVRRETWRRLRIHHHVTSSKARRTRSNPLFPVNLADLLLRHGSANHRRETIAFSKRRQAAMERLAIFTVWRNYIKRRQENGPACSTAMGLKLVDRLLTWRQVLRRRRFPSLAELPEEWTQYYWGKVRTAALGDRQADHTCTYAY